MGKDPLQCGGARGDHFQFGSVFIKKNNQTGYLKKNQNRFKPTGLGSLILEQKSVQTGLAWFFQFDSVFLVWLGPFFGFFVWIQFSLVFSVSGL